VLPNPWIASTGAGLIVVTLAHQIWLGRVAVGQPPNSENARVNAGIGIGAAPPLANIGVADVKDR